MRWTWNDSLCIFTWHKRKSSICKNTCWCEILIFYGCKYWANFSYISPETKKNYSILKWLAFFGANGPKWPVSKAGWTNFVHPIGKQLSEVLVIQIRHHQHQRTNFIRWCLNRYLASSVFVPTKTRNCGSRRCRKPQFLLVGVAPQTPFSAPRLGLAARSFHERCFSSDPGNDGVCALLQSGK